MTIHASAPVRLDFAGGWTDVAPFATDSRGVVVNAAIGLRALVTLEPHAERYHLEARDLADVVTGTDPADIERQGAGLLGAAVRLYRLGPCRIVVRSEAPPGSGLGSSGAIGVALVAACEAAAGRTPPPAEIAERAWELEAVEAAVPGGRQDQFAAAAGGFQRLEFSAAGVTARPLALRPAFAELLAERLVVAYTGESRVSGDTIARVMNRYTAGDAVVADALREMTVVADAMALALAESDIGAVGKLLSRNWSLQQRLDGGMRTPLMGAIEDAAGAAGTLGGKAAGAGAGGTMFFLADRDHRAVANAVRDAGATLLPLHWSGEGVRVW